MTATCRPSVKSFVAAGQRMHIAQCGRCGWVARSSRDDHEMAWADARSHGGVGA